MKALMALGVLSSFLVLAFLVWLLFFGPAAEPRSIVITVLYGVGIVVALFIANILPFIGPLVLLPALPVLAEVLFLDVGVGSVSIVAWVVTAIVFHIRAGVGMYALYEAGKPD